MKKGKKKLQELFSKSMNKKKGKDLGTPQRKGQGTPQKKGQGTPQKKGQGTPQNKGLGTGTPQSRTPSKFIVKVIVEFFFLQNSISMLMNAV